MEYLDLRTAFYPCCGKDIKVPLHLLCPFVDRVIFCDKSTAIAENYYMFIGKLSRNRLSSKIIIGSAIDALNSLQRIDVLFYRCDSAGEGGSGVNVLGNIFMQSILDRMPLQGGLIITDGSNSRQSNFEKMTRPHGVNKFGWHLEPYPEQPRIIAPDLRSYRGNGVLNIIQATPIIGETCPPKHYDPDLIYF